MSNALEHQFSFRQTYTIYLQWTECISLVAQAQNQWKTQCWY